MISLHQEQKSAVEQLAKELEMTQELLWGKLVALKLLIFDDGTMVEKIYKSEEEMKFVCKMDVNKESTSPKSSKSQPKEESKKENKPKDDSQKDNQPKENQREEDSNKETQPDQPKEDSKHQPDQPKDVTKQGGKLNDDVKQEADTQRTTKYQNKCVMRMHITDLPQTLLPMPVLEKGIGASKATNGKEIDPTKAANEKDQNPAKGNNEKDLEAAKAGNENPSQDTQGENPNAQ